MIVTAEISYYPLSDNFEEPVDAFIKRLKAAGLSVEVGKMSTLVSGDYTVLMQVLSEAMESLFEKYPSVFNLKISNSCMV